VIPSKTREEINEIVMGIVENRIFTHLHIHDQQRDLTTVFMVLLLMESKDIEWLKKARVGLIYEYMDKAAPRSINGYPCFFSCQYTNEEDMEIIKRKVLSVRKSMKEALRGNVQEALNFGTREGVHGTLQEAIGGDEGEQA